MRNAVVLLALLCTACPGTRAPGDPFGIHRQEELWTICHADAGAPTGVTQRYNRTMAKWHLKHHQFDIGEACYVPVLSNTVT